MSKIRSLPRAARPLALAALSLAVVGAMALPQQAHASAFQLKENSAKALGTAFAGSTTSGGDASVVVNNPAAMSLLKGNVFQADVTAINFSTKFSGSAHDAFGAPISGGNGGDGGTTIPVPALYFVSQVSDRMHLGFAISAPFGFRTNWDRDWVGRYHARKSDFQSLDATLSASFDVSDNFSLGASFIAQQTKAELTSAINFNAVGNGLIAQAVAAGKLDPGLAPIYASVVNQLIPAGTDGEARIKGDDWAYGWQLGALWQLTPNDRLGLNYHSKISHKLRGKANFQVPTAVTDLLANPLVAPLLGDGTPFTNTTGVAPFTTPAFTSLSYWHQGQRFGFGVDLTYTQWDVFKELRVTYANPAQPDSVEEFNWRNTLFASVGAEYYATDKLTLRAGLAMDSTPTSNATRDPRVPDQDRRWISFGMGYKVSDKLDINAGYAHIFVDKAHVNATSPTNDVITGSFDDKGNLFSISAAYHF